MTEMLSVLWIKSTRGTWLPLEAVNLSNVRTIGVYVIWHGGNPQRAVKIGQGDIAERVSHDRSDKKILAYRSRGTLFVTWAAVPVEQMDGVERFLGSYYKPLVLDRHPDTVPIPVNLPAAA